MSGQVLRVLLVEDDSAYARLVAEYLKLDRSATYELTRAKSLKEALGLLAGQGLVLLDLGLPDAVGSETLTTLRGMAPHLPIVVLSGREDVETALECMRAGAQEFLVKGEADRLLLPRAIRYALERKRLEELEQLLVGVVSHDLRGPLQTIALVGQLIAREEDSPLDRRKLSARIAGAVGQANGLLQDLLDVTRVRVSGAIPIDLRASDAHSVVRNVLAEVRAKAPDRLLECDLRGEGAGLWDPGRLHQLLVNLLDNALRHSVEAEPVRVVCDGTAAEEVRLHVHNSGAPIPEPLLGRLFEPLQHGEGGGGVGLGLYIVRQIALAHGGNVKVRSTPAEGTEFTVQLPRSARTGEAA